MRRGSKDRQIDLLSRGLDEARANIDAVTAAVTALSGAATTGQAIQVALEVVRERFGWVYGSHWRLDADTGRLVFSQEVGDSAPEFQRVTRSASFGLGEGVSGRAWKQRELVFVADIGEVNDCVRAPAAQQAGLKSGVCFPLLEGDDVVGTMDFFTTETLDPSEHRLDTLRSVAVLVSQACERIAEAERQHHAEQDLDTVNRILRTVSRAGSCSRCRGRASAPRRAGPRHREQDPAHRVPRRDR